MQSVIMSNSSPSGGSKLILNSASKIPGQEGEGVKRTEQWMKGTHNLKR
jgi:hypothetical protein